MPKMRITPEAKLLVESMFNLNIERPEVTADHLLMNSTRPAARQAVAMLISHLQEVRTILMTSTRKEVP